MKKLILVILALLIVFEVSRSSMLEYKDHDCFNFGTKIVLVQNEVANMDSVIECGVINDTMRLQYMTVYAFKDTLAYYESRRIYNITNKFGFKGKYQFSNSMIGRFGRVPPKKFLIDSLVQEQAMSLACIFYIQYIYRCGYNKYINRKISGVTVTLESLMLGVHFSPLYLKKWLESDGRDNGRDINTSIGDYMRKFENRGFARIVDKKFCF